MCRYAINRWPNTTAYFHAGTTILLSCFKSAQKCLRTVIGLKLYPAISDVWFSMIMLFHQNVPRDPVGEGETLQITVVMLTDCT